MTTKSSRAAVGKLQPTTDGKRNYAFFVPTDSRIPRMMIPAAEIDPRMTIFCLNTDNKMLQVFLIVRKTSRSSSTLLVWTRRNGQQLWSIQKGALLHYFD
jgi:hypothetical protein